MFSCSSARKWTTIFELSDKNSEEFNAPMNRLIKSCLPANSIHISIVNQQPENWIWSFFSISLARQSDYFIARFFPSPPSFLQSSPNNQSSQCTCCFHFVLVLFCFCFISSLNFCVCVHVHINVLLEIISSQSVINAHKQARAQEREKKEERLHQQWKQREREREKNWT